MTSSSMIYDKFTLAFPDQNEKLFLKKYFSDSLSQFRKSFLLVTFLYASFSYLDFRVPVEYVKPFLFIRFAIVVPILLSVFFLSYTKIFPKIWQLLIMISTLVGGLGIIIMTVLIPDNYAYYAGLMLVFSAGYFFVKLRFIFSSISGWTLILIYNIGAIFFSDTSNLILLNNNFFFISANILGMAAAYNIEYYARYNFFLNTKLENEKSKIEEINQNLEYIVSERTKELEKAKDKAEESDRLKSAFLANMSHEIRTPMNSILGFSDLLKNPELSGDEQQDYIHFIETSGERMLNIINDIIDISKIEAGLMQLDVVRLNINTIIENIFHSFKFEVESKGMQLSYKTPLPKELSYLYTDQEKLYAIFTNLVKNAIKYSIDGEIEFGYSIKGSLLECYVQDTGIGIPTDRLNAIFERFIQADIADSQARQGAGLGLSISKAYIEMLGGLIWVESEIDKGSTFYFTLPMREL